MTSFGWAMVGAVLFVLAYAYYTVAGLFYLPGGDAASRLIEFAATAGLVLLFAVVAGASLAPGSPTKK